MSVTYGRSVVFFGTLVSSTNKTCRKDIAEIFLKVALSTITQTYSWKGLEIHIFGRHILFIFRPILIAFFIEFIELKASGSMNFFCVVHFLGYTVQKGTNKCRISIFLPVLFFIKFNAAFFFLFFLPNDHLYGLLMGHYKIFLLFFFCGKGVKIRPTAGVEFKQKLPDHHGDNY